MMRRRLFHRKRIKQRIRVVERNWIVETEQNHTGIFSVRCWVGLKSNNYGQTFFIDEDRGEVDFPWTKIPKYFKPHAEKFIAQIQFMLL